MSSSGQLPIVVIACKVFQDLLERHLADDQASQITFLDYGLHRVPDKLTWAVQDAIDSVKEASLIVLGYGLCGNGLNGVKAGVHTLLIPRTDDCIAILLGSYDAYMRQFETEPGTYYLTKGWLESGSNPLQEFQEAARKYGEESATWIMDQQYQHYKRLVFVAHNQADLEKYRPQAREVASYCERWGMQYEEVLGSEGYVQRLVAAAGSAFGSPNQAGGDFLVIPPGGELRQNQFMR